MKSKWTASEQLQLIKLKVSEQLVKVGPFKWKLNESSGPLIEESKWTASEQFHSPPIDLFTTFHEPPIDPFSTFH